MRFLDEHRRRPAALADHLPWAALVAPGVVLNKDGSFLTGFRFRGPDLESSTDDELMAVRARLNNALRRLGSGWCLHVEARRRGASPYPESDFDIDVAWLLDEERRSRFETADPAFETDFRLALTWLPPADETRRLERWLFDGLQKGGQDWRLALGAFARRRDRRRRIPDGSAGRTAHRVGDVEGADHRGRRAGRRSRFGAAAEARRSRQPSAHRTQEGAADAIRGV